jgi:hypothetical protein
MGNDGRARVLVALEPRSPDEPPMSPRSSPVRMANDPALVNALESHIKTLQGENDVLKEQLAGAEARTEKQAADFAERDARAAADLAAEKAKAEKASAEFAAMVDRLTTLADEKAKTDKAIAAFAALAERLDALAAERVRPWWRRLAACRT